MDLDDDIHSSDAATDDTADPLADELLADSADRESSDDDDGLDKLEFLDDVIVKRRKGRAILGHSELQEIASDIRKTILPRWLQSGPVHLGKRAHGKLSADAWRMVGTVHLLLTLVRLWGWMEPTTHQYKALQNFMLLAHAVTLATRRTTTIEHRQTVDSSLRDYLRGLRDIYEASIETNHHMALHTPYFLNMLGPPHSWWAFPYERYNGMLQNTQTNRLFGAHAALHNFFEILTSGCLRSPGGNNNARLLQDVHASTHHLRQSKRLESSAPVDRPYGLGMEATSL